MENNCMTSLADKSVLDECLNRLARLEPSGRARWGRMTAHQMVCHLFDSFGVAAGVKSASPATGPFQRTVLKWIALRTPLAWPQGVPTRPEIEQGRGGTPPSDWVRDCEKLRDEIVTFSARRTFGIHPIFGKMSWSDWLVWGYRHVDHHFRQFGV
jgi:hypothetical protein